MPYTPVAKFPNLPELEHRVLRLWEETNAFEKLRQKNRGGPKWSFLDGPITANNPMGVHHAWGRALKDLYQRYHAMCGQEQRYQNGFDCQGLWVEVEVEKERGFTSKQDIESYGAARFVQDCKDRVIKYSGIQTEQSIRLGFWMDWSNSYYTMTDENNYTIWSFLKRCHRRGHVYRGLDTMPWCPRCGVGLSQMELHEGYRWVEHLSVLVRFPIRGRDHEALLVWTTTPWTLTANVGAAVHPEMTYYKVRQGEWTYVVGADNWNGERVVEVEEESAHGKKRRTVRLPSIPQHLATHGPCEVVGEVSGRELLGLEYDGPFDELPAQHDPGGCPHRDERLADRSGVTCHRVVAWDAVTGSEGTGIVHIAPGCGAEDFELGNREGLVAISPLDDAGRYLSRFGDLAGVYAHDVGKTIAASLKGKGLLVGTEQYPHRYAHCWRCGTPIVYRLVDEWFINMDWRGEIMGTVEQIRWIPDFGQQLEMDWLRNMGDWMISKKRYWGLALPIWRCDRHAAEDPARRCDWFDVIGSKEELQDRAIAGWAELEGNSPHRPWVDAVKVRCERCGDTASRIPEVGNPWLDAGIVPYSTMGYNSDRATWHQWFPADLVLECFPGQFRNWFYALLAMNAMMQEDCWADRQDGTSRVVPPFRTLLGYALVRDEEGREMHKSLGNAIEFNAAAEKIGAEAMRYIYAAQTPTSNLNFPDISDSRPKDRVHRDQEVYREILTFWNCYSFYVTYAAVDGITPAQLTVPLAERSELDRWILSKLDRLVELARDSFEGYRVHLLMQSFERFVNELSTWYLRRSRRRFWKSESDTDKLAAYTTLYQVLETLCRLIAPVLPFLTEEVYQNLVRSVQPTAPVSVHLLAYPEVCPERRDAAAEARVDAVVRYCNLGLRLRNESGVKVRQPLARLLLKPETETERAALGSAALQAQLAEELNVKAIELLDSTEGLLDVTVKANFKVLGPRYGRHMKEIQAHLAATPPQGVRAALASSGSYHFTAADGAVIELLPADLEITEKAAADLACATDGGAFVALDTRLTPALTREGLARDFVRGVQEHRKELDLHVADRIRLRYTAAAEVAEALVEWADFIGRETLAVEVLAEPDPMASPGKVLKVGGQAVSIRVEVVSAGA